MAIDPVADWQATRDTLHLHTQVVGKIRLANEPLTNHWWNSTLYVTACGFTTSLMPHPSGEAFQIDFDFLRHRLDIATLRCRASLDLEGATGRRLLQRRHGDAERPPRHYDDLADAGQNGAHDHG